VTGADGTYEVDDPTSGQRWVFRREGGGEVLEADLYVSRGGFVREHLHPSQEETFTGVEGTFVLSVGGERRELAPGDTVVIPPRTRHGFRDAPDDAHVRVTVRPALELESYFRAFLGLSRDGRLRMPVEGLPHPLLQAAVLLDRYADEIAAPELPVRLQRPVWWALGALGRLRGYRSTLPEYGAF
jgi:quercetin dioxygenase-like cupin family protein